MRETSDLPRLAVGTPVDVRDRFMGSWHRGFEIAEQVGDGYRILRLSDHSLLPDVFGPEEIRLHRRSSGFWWH